MTVLYFPNICLMTVISCEVVHKDFSIMDLSIRLDKIIKLSSDVHLVVEVPHPNPVGFSRNLGELDDPGGLEDIVDPGIALTNSQIMI